MSQTDKAADLLFQARLTGQRLPDLPDDCLPANLAEAYAVQDALVKRLLDRHGGQVAGYKIACTNKAAQEFLNLDAPFFGRLLSSAIHAGPAQLKAGDFFMRVIEPEFGFEMAKDLPPKSTGYSRAEVVAAIGAIIPSIEIVDSRYQEWTAVGAVSLIADQAVHGAWVRGEPVADWQSLDLATHQVQLWVNGELSQTGNGAAVLGHPLNVLTWLANALNTQGRALNAGDMITTGVCVDKVYDASPNDQIRVNFGSLGTVEVTFEDI